MVEYAALKYKGFIDAAMAKKQSYKNGFSTAVHGNDCFEATQHIDPRKADLKTPADVDVCKWVKSSLTTLANRHGQLKAKVEASGWSKTTQEIETWERAYERSKTGNAADPVALYLYLVWDDKDIGTFSAILDDVRASSSAAPLRSPLQQLQPPRAQSGVHDIHQGGSRLPRTLST
jgi:hypothetical protein